MNFSQTWEQIVSTLKANAETLGISPDSIEEGKSEEPQIAPFLWVYCVPQPVAQAESGAKIRRAKVSVFCGAATAATLAEALKNAVTLAEKAETVLNGLYRYTAGDITYYDTYSDKTVVELTGFIRYGKSI